jgi:hypothetical protein
MYKKVTYRDRRDGKIKDEWFDVKGSRKKTSFTIDKRSEKITLEFMKQDHVEYLGSWYYETKHRSNNNGTNKHNDKQQ